MSIRAHSPPGPPIYIIVQPKSTSHKIILSATIVSELEKIGKEIALQENKDSVNLVGVISRLIDEHKSNYRSRLKGG